MCYVIMAIVLMMMACIQPNNDSNSIINNIKCDVCVLLLLLCIGIIGFIVIGSSINGVVTMCVCVCVCDIIISVNYSAGIVWQWLLLIVWYWLMAKY